MSRYSSDADSDYAYYKAVKAKNRDSDAFDDGPSSDLEDRPGRYGKYFSDSEDSLHGPATRSRPKTIASPTVCRTLELLKEFYLFNEKLLAKDWLLTADSNAMNELCLNLNENEKLRWTYTGEQVTNIVNFSHEMLRSKEKTSFDLFRYVKWASLRRLMINAPVNYARFKLSRVNCFKNLQHLEVSYYNGCNDYLELPRLLILRIDSTFVATLRAKLPELRMLETNIGLSQICLEKSDSVRHLHIHSFEGSVTKFANLECLSIRNASVHFYHILKQLPGLVKVEFEPAIAPTVIKESFMDILQALLDEKHKLNRRKLCFYLNRKLVPSVERIYSDKTYTFVADFQGEFLEYDEFDSD